MQTKQVNPCGRSRGGERDRELQAAAADRRRTLPGLHGEVQRVYFRASL